MNCLFQPNGCNILWLSTASLAMWGLVLQAAAVVWLTLLLSSVCASRKVGQTWDSLAQ